MSNTLLGLGIAVLVAAIVGGGLKAFGFEFPVIASTKRQLAVAGLGICLIISAEWNDIRSVLFPTTYVTERKGPITLEHGRTHNLPLVLNRGGAIEVVLESLDPDWTGFTGQRNGPGQGSLHVTICASVTIPPCPSRQVGLGEAFSQQLPIGSAAISIFNFDTNPTMKFTLRITHPR
jgi:hypothetical protein